MNIFKRILICGAIFAIGIPFGFFISETIYVSVLHTDPRQLIVDTTTMWLGAAVVFWLIGCAVAAVMLAIEKGTSRFQRPWLVSLSSGVLIPLVPLILLMIRNKALFFAQDNLILAVAGLCTGIAVALTGLSKVKSKSSKE